MYIIISSEKALYLLRVICKGNFRFLLRFYGNYVYDYNNVSIKGDTLTSYFVQCLPGPGHTTAWFGSTSSLGMPQLAVSIK
jgi:hypothetical protein